VNFVEEEGILIVTSKAAATMDAVITVIMKAGLTTVLFPRRLRDHGIVAAPVFFPAVPQDSTRLRPGVTAVQETGE
jgi:7-keto-8-aminopelargonate synthetase-like enzyme